MGSTQSHNSEEPFSIAGEYVICRKDHIDTLMVEQARCAAKEISNAEDNSWSYVLYVQDGRLMREAYFKGQCLSIEDISEEQSDGFVDESLAI